MAVIIHFNKDMITTDRLFSAAPSGALNEMIFLVGLYIMKSISVFAPVVALYMLGGRFFPPITAIIINCLGLFMGMSLQYFIGRFSGKDIVDSIIKKWPKFESIIKNRQKDTTIFACFIRFAGGLPMDAVSIFFGANNLPYIKYICGSILGCLPDLIFYTLFAASLTMDNKSLFWICIILKLIITIIIGIILYKRFKNEKEKQNKI